MTGDDTPRLPPLRKEIVVDGSPAVAFRVFTDRIGDWWPLERFSVHGADATVAFVDGTIVETGPDGQRAEWGEVTRWEPPGALAFTWHPGRDPESPSSVAVTFVPVGDRTVVRLEHDGWESFADPLGARTEYGNGWSSVLDRLRAVAEDSATDGWTLVALVHRPSDPDVDVFADPRFAQHQEFLLRMRDSGQLVAAGPLTDEHGAGMTVLRLPGSDRLDEATRLATEDDASVRAGLFEVSVRPWRVVLC